VVLDVETCVFVCVLVSRLHCESESFKMDLILDVNTQIYPVDLGISVTFVDMVVSHCNVVDQLDQKYLQCGTPVLFFVLTVFIILKCQNNSVILVCSQAVVLNQISCTVIISNICDDSLVY